MIIVAIVMIMMKVGDPYDDANDDDDLDHGGDDDDNTAADNEYNDKDVCHNPRVLSAFR